MKHRCISNTRSIHYKGSSNIKGAHCLGICDLYSHRYMGMTQMEEMHHNTRIFTITNQGSNQSLFQHPFPFDFREWFCHLHSTIIRWSYGLQTHYKAKLKISQNINYFMKPMLNCWNQAMPLTNEYLKNCNQLII